MVDGMLSVVQGVARNDLRAVVQKYVHSVYEEYRSGRLSESEWTAAAIWLAKIDREIIQGPRQYIALPGQEA